MGDAAMPAAMAQFFFFFLLDSVTLALSDTICHALSLSDTTSLSVSILQAILTSMGDADAAMAAAMAQLADVESVDEDGVDNDYEQEEQPYGRAYAITESVDSEWGSVRSRVASTPLVHTSTLLVRGGGEGPDLDALVESVIEVGSFWAASRQLLGSF
jgi:hypothetical protein